MDATFWHLLLHLLLLYMGVSDIKGVATQSIIKNLPGFSGDLPFKLETGYVGVGEKDEIQLFYYFIESEKSPKDDPLVLWITGGPGCSGFSALIYETGPFTITPDKSGLNSTALQLNPYAWTKIANIIFLDQPVGTGYSYATSREAYYTSDTLSAKTSYNFLKKSAEANCKGEYSNIDPSNVLCLNDYATIKMCLNGISAEYILESDLCTRVLTEDSLNIIHSVVDDQLPNQPQCHDSNSTYGYIWANDRAVQSGLHIREYLLDAV
ncbi:hypothetical protein FNV43_RR22227 [Rhamnella rubrinervis]|uniref:Serine carboxypeptidase n=1 Tax=Rhamnella rubrinervis TaxID=2594499 RepID=A0A8K0DQ31_9ROSA|nr:hypothetical protein FNV43_RR22227 [Rhamnella rubrinervis]